jgi:hypothetical protein
MAGYSGTPLAKKLGIQSQFRVAFFRLPPEVKAELQDSLTLCRARGPGPLDFVVIFVKSQAELRKQFPHFARQLAPAGMLWVSWPKKNSGVTSDLSENDVRRIGLEAGLVDVKVCAVSEIWSGLKLVIRVQDRPKKT